MSHYLGIIPRWLDGTMVGGCSFMLHVRHAAGACETVLITHGESGRSRVGLAYPGASQASLAGQFEYPYGAVPPYATFTLPVLRFLQERGMTRRHLAEVAVAQREWAMHNPRAFKREPVEDGQELPPGKVGQMYFGAPGIDRFAYYKDPAKTAAMRRGNLITVGDLGYLDKEGWLYLSDRRTDMILSGGVNIYSAEIEARLMEHTAVADAAVIGVPDEEEWGQRVIAFIQPRA